MAFEARRRTTLDSGEDVRRSYRTIERSDAAEANMEVSVWLKASVLMVSVDVGQCSVCVAAEEGRDKSKIEIRLDEAAKLG